MDRRLKLLGNYTARWSGAALDPQGLVRLANGGGSHDPLIWVFNEQEPFEVMAAGLGPGQPLIGLRSLNQIVPVAQLGAGVNRWIAAVYLDLLAPLLAGRRFFLGGNCQGGLIATELAAQLLRQGCDLRGFIALENDRLLPLPVPGCLIFGTESPKFNPFLKGEDPWPRWRQQFQAVTLRMVPGAHGTFFSATTAPLLADHLREAMAVAPPRPAVPRPRPALDAALPAAPVAAGSEVVLTLDPAALPSDAAMILACWSHEDGPHFLQTIASPARPAAGGRATLHLPTPPEPGHWRLQLYRTLAGAGPVDWWHDSAISHRVTLVAAPGTAGT